MNQLGGDTFDELATFTYLANVHQVISVRFKKITYCLVPLILLTG